MAITNGAFSRIGVIVFFLLATFTSLGQNANGPNLDVAYLFGYGEYLIDSRGQTLYAFTEDSDGKSSCYDQCAENWPPVIVESATPTSVSELATGEVGAIEREDGSLQLTYNAMPLYTFTQDEAIGDVTGNGVSGVWFLISGSGELIRVSSQEATASSGAISGGAASEDNPVCYRKSRPEWMRL